MGNLLDAKTRAWLLRARIHRMPEASALDPHSPEYLYVVQQRKRLSLAASVGRLRPRNILLVPLIGMIVLLKTVDLWITNQIVRSFINEHDLSRLGKPTLKAPD